MRERGAERERQRVRDRQRETTRERDATVTKDKRVRERHPGGERECVSEATKEESEGEAGGE